MKCECGRDLVEVTVEIEQEEPYIDQLCTHCDFGGDPDNKPGDHIKDMVAGSIPLTKLEFNLGATDAIGHPFVDRKQIQGSYSFKGKSLMNISGKLPSAPYDITVNRGDGSKIVIKNCYPTVVEHESSSDGGLIATVKFKGERVEVET
tara:strand:- start:394 stop:837 length:444 start_codon:yes stop_codon:yes gene_type:complete